MADWKNNPQNTTAHESVLKELRNKDDYALTLGQSGTVFTNLPIGAMFWDESGKLFRRWNGSEKEVRPISVAGGGTGSTDALGARANIGADDADNLTKGRVPTARLSASYDISITGNAATATNATNATTANNALLLDGNSAAFYRNASNLNSGTVPEGRLTSGTTAGKGIVQLVDSVASGSTTTAATPNSVKQAFETGKRLEILTAASGAWTVPPEVTSAKVTVVAGGGAGGYADTAAPLAPNAGGGGGAGGFGVKWITGLTPGQNIAYTVAQAQTSSGGSGGSTSFYGVTATGGTGGNNADGNDVFGLSGNGGGCTGADINASGGAGWHANANPFASGAGASCPFGVGGFFRTSADADGVDATGYGAGGGGATNSGNTKDTGGSGAPGVIIIEY